MSLSRRELAALLPALAAASPAKVSTLPGGAWPFESLKLKDNGQNRARSVFDGLTHSGFHIDMHETELDPGKMPHAAHHHDHEELIMVREGLVEVTIADKSTKLGPGSVAYFSSGVEHGLKNVGDTIAQYFVLALDRPNK